MKKTWNQLFMRQGWMLAEKEENVFDCRRETGVNLQFLIKSLKTACVELTLKDGELTLPVVPISEEEWLSAVDFEGRGRGEGLWFKPGVDEPKVNELDTYISGIVRQLNRLGFYTKGSCDGHKRGAAHIMLTKDCDIEKISGILLTLGNRKIFWRERANSYHLSLHLDRTQLLDLAEKLSLIKEDWLVKGMEFIREKLFQYRVEELLMIPGESGNEREVRSYVANKLTPFVDYLTIDRTGNLLAEKVYNGGNGPVILLNAHLDTVFEIEEGREIIKNGTLWTSSKGILGADDRAGVAILLHIAEHLQHSSFKGKVKFIFTVEEECGLVGANHVDGYFLWNTDAAIVVDRRGKGDIVTSCGGYIPFCHPLYGTFFENTAEEEGLAGWAVTPGGSSDTRVWALHGIQSVNLSAGYYDEHTEEESLDVAACYRTAQLIQGVFERRNELRKVLRDIKRKERGSDILSEAL
ncbi:M20/M25/M40 family metallo-hydrolase [Rossellomorea vietnamensis]|uniref:M20/M25/M40 family metallo-hydrolase n=1 Tax=Rossellomorea vietnamensis TaxID=218284 RepID=UPI003CF527CA